MSTLIESLKRQIKRLEAKHGSDSPFVKDLNEQLRASEETSGKTAHEVFRMQTVDFSPPADDPPETEEDGIRARAIQIAQYRHQAEQMRQRIAAKPVSPEKLQQREKRHQEQERKLAAAVANAERDAPIRVRFHAWMERSGLRPMAIPEPGRSYSGSHIETLWEAYLDATLNERNDTTKNGELPMTPRPQSAQDMQDESIANRGKPRKLPVKNQTASMPQDNPPARRKFRISVDYGYDIHSVTVSAKVVDQIKRGEAVTVKGQGFYIEGEKTKDVWSFHCTGPNALEVEAGEDGHEIFIGEVTDVKITEVK